MTFSSLMCKIFIYTVNRFLVLPSIFWGGREDHNVYKILHCISTLKHLVSSTRRVITTRYIMLQELLVHNYIIFLFFYYKILSIIRGCRKSQYTIHFYSHDIAMDLLFFTEFLFFKKEVSF